MESPGMPKTRAGIHAPASALLLAEPDSTMPSTWPVPNFSGSLENFLLTAYDIHAAMSAPAPGNAPTSVPSALQRRIHVDREADDFGDGEHADHHRNQADATQQLGVAEGEARIRRGIAEAHL